jgi:hypothetical protein
MYTPRERYNAAEAGLEIGFLEEHIEVRCSSNRYEVSEDESRYQRFNISQAIVPRPKKITRRYG